MDKFVKVLESENEERLDSFRLLPVSELCRVLLLLFLEDMALDRLDVSPPRLEAFSIDELLERREDPPRAGGLNDFEEEEVGSCWLSEEDAAL